MEIPSFIKEMTIGKAMKILAKFGGAITVVGGASWMTFKPFVDGYIEQRVQEIILEHDSSHVSLDIQLSKLMKVDKDQVAVVMFDKLNLVDSTSADIAKFRENFLPFLEQQMEVIVCYFYIDKDGQEWWVGKDGRPHPVVDYQDGKGWYVYHGEKRFIYE